MNRRNQAQRPPRKTQRFSPARLTAFTVMRDVAERDAYANLALQARIREAKLSDQDAAFATELVSGTLRLAGRYDAIIELATGRPREQIDQAVLTVLRLGVHQLLTLDTPAHAAIHEQVELVKHVAGMRVSGFVNGVLRTISRTSEEEWLRRITETVSDPREQLALVHSHPRWIVDALGDALESGGHGDELEEALIANNRSPKVQLAVLSGELTPELSGENLVATEGSPIAYELTAGNPAQVIAGLADNGVLAKVQDQGSQLAALVLARAGAPQPGESWLDLCAGPGGKTAVLGSEALRLGATVRANEVAPHRAELVRDSVQGVAEAVTVVSHDGRAAEAFGGQVFDRILVDAPCTGLGALRRRPEARWRKTEADLEQLTKLQQELLTAATEHLAPGGYLAYVTCSPHLAETRDVVAAHLAKYPDLERCDVQHQLAEIGATSAEAQLWPHRDRSDAMFIALMHRPSDHETQ